MTLNDKAINLRGGTSTTEQRQKENVMSIHVKKTNILTLRAKKRRKIKTVLVTAYDIWQAQLADQAGVDAILVEFDF